MISVRIRPVFALLAAGGLLMAVLWVASTCETRERKQEARAWGDTVEALEEQLEGERERREEVERELEEERERHAHEVREERTRAREAERRAAEASQTALEAAESLEGTIAALPPSEAKDSLSAQFERHMAADRAREEAHAEERRAWEAQIEAWAALSARQDTAIEALREEIRALEEVNRALGEQARAWERAANPPIWERVQGALPVIGGTAVVTTAAVLALK